MESRELEVGIFEGRLGCCADPDRNTNLRPMTKANNKTAPIKIAAGANPLLCMQLQDLIEKMRLQASFGWGVTLIAKSSEIQKSECALPHSIRKATSEAPALDRGFVSIVLVAWDGTRFLATGTINFSLMIPASVQIS